MDLKSIAEADVEFSFSAENVCNTHVMSLYKSPETFKRDEICNGCTPVAEIVQPKVYCRLFLLISRTESDIAKKYSEMSFKDLKHECIKYGLPCFGLKQDYCKRLVAYELEKMVSSTIFDNI